MCVFCAVVKNAAWYLFFNILYVVMIVLMAILTLGSSWYGRAFIRTYYAISPTLVKWFGRTKCFKKMRKGKLDRMVKKLQNKGVEDAPYKDREW